MSAWRLVKRIMSRAGVTGSRASPRGLRHSFAVGALHASIPINLTQRWLGHARISTTALYAAACGPEEIAFAARFWKPSALPGTFHSLSRAAVAIPPHGKRASALAHAAL